MANDKDFVVNGPVVVGKDTKVTVGTIGSGQEGYNLAGASYDNVSFSVAGQDTAPFGFAFNNDGTKMYMVGPLSDSVYQYTLSTAFDLSTASYDSVSFSVNSQDANPSGIAFNTDGSKMYMVGTGNDRVYQYSLSTAFDLSTASYDSVNLYVVNQDTSPRGIAFNNVGTKMYMVGTGNNRVHQYSLSTAFDLSTASYDSVFLSVSGQDASPYSIAFNADGTKMYMVGATNGSVYQYSLSTAFDLSTASYDSVSFSVSGQDTAPLDIALNTDGTKMFVLGNINDSIYQYSTTLTTAELDFSTGNYFDDTLAADTTYTFSNAGDVQAFQLEVTGYVIITNNWDISTASYSQNFSVAAQETSPRDLFFKPDGTKMYITGESGDDVNEYDLSTAWDLSTASYNQNFSISAQDTGPQGLFFKTDGTKMYITGSSSDRVHEYNLSTAWDVSTASILQNFSVSSQDTFPQSIFFKPDGTKMYIVGSAGVDVNEYDLSTAWDVSTASFLQNFSVSSQDTGPTGVSFKSDGTKMYIAGAVGDDVNEYDLSTAWDISTASYNQNFTVAAQDTAPTGVSFKPDGTKMYIVGVIGDAVSEYDIGSSSVATLTWPSSIEWAGGIAPAAPANGETDVFTFTTNDSGTTYTGVKSIDNAS